MQHPVDDAAWGELESLLLSIGGQAVARTFEEDLYKLLKRGKRWPAKVLVEPGNPSQCHVNTANLYVANEGRAKIITGWALGPRDGIWRQHSWLRWGKRLVETTLKRDDYFGFELTKTEAEEFANENY